MAVKQEIPSTMVSPNIFDLMVKEFPEEMVMVEGNVLTFLNTSSDDMMRLESLIALHGSRENQDYLEKNLWKHTEVIFTK